MEDLIIHHFGIVINSVDKYLENSFFTSIEKKVYDPIQQSNLVLLKTNNNIYLELIEPVSKKATTYNFLKKRGGGYHHICFVVKNQNYLDQIISDKKIKIIWGPQPAILFDNKIIVFGYTQNKELVEFIINN
ncbi:MAG: VOC family protein [Mariniphaga sp.]|nr:VOC family protein [Mariniphaga sp.]